MSTYEKREINCPHCTAKNTHSIAKSLNGPRVPDVITAIQEGRFQRFGCEGCGQTYAVDHPMVFLDFDNHIWMYMFPKAWEAQWAELEEQSKESWRTNMIEQAPGIVRSISAGFRLRTVFGLDGLRDKLVCFGAQLDDVLIELLKLDLLRTSPGLTMHPACRPVLAHATDEVFVFHAKSPGEGDETTSVQLTVPRARYNAIRNDPMAWSTAHRKISAGPYVDIGRIMLVSDGEAPAAE